jgi:hypothetical protein
LEHLSFAIVDTKGFMLKLLEDYQEFSGNVLSSRIAINCAMTSWHLIEWVFYEYESINYRTDKKAYKENFNVFRADIIKKCPFLQMMNDIADGSKHCTLATKRKHKTALKDGGFHPP